MGQQDGGERILIKIQIIFWVVMVLGMAGMILASCAGPKKSPTPIPNAVSSKVRFETYKDSKGEHRWRIVNIGNNKIMADSAEGYINRQDMIDAILVVKTCGLALIEESKRGQ
jgi:uncharacterized protein YegP (UPF0339 family)